MPKCGAFGIRFERIESLLGELSLDEKIAMLSGHGFFEQIAADGGRYCASLYAIGAGNERLGIPPLLFNDGPRGIGMGSSTCFPVPMARGASFDVDLERRIGDDRHAGLRRGCLVFWRRRRVYRRRFRRIDAKRPIRRVQRRHLPRAF